ncbi:hypothetical protein EVG20_g4163, partial [Dentipellis fragilis]
MPQAFLTQDTTCRSRATSHCQITLCSSWRNGAETSPSSVPALAHTAAILWTRWSLRESVAFYARSDCGYFPRHRHLDLETRLVALVAPSPSPSPPPPPPPPPHVPTRPCRPPRQSHNCLHAHVVALAARPTPPMRPIARTHPRRLRTPATPICPVTWAPQVRPAHGPAHPHHACLMHAPSPVHR